MINKLIILTVLLLAGTKAGITKAHIDGLLTANFQANGVEPFQLCEEKTDLELQARSQFLTETLQAIQSDEYNRYFLDNRRGTSSQVQANAQAFQVEFNSQARFEEFVLIYQRRIIIGTKPDSAYRFPGVYHGKCYYVVGCSDETETNCTVHITYFQEALGSALDTFLNAYKNFNENNRWKALISVSLAYAIKAAHDNGIIMKNFPLSNLGFRESRLANLNNKMLVVPVTVCFLNMINVTFINSTVNYPVTEGNYQAPEFKAHNIDPATPQFTEATDVYTLGITIYAIFNYKQWTNRDGKGKGYQILPCPGADSFFCKHYKEFFESVTNDDPAQRITIENAINLLITILNKIDKTNIVQFAFDEVKTGISFSMPNIGSFMGSNETPNYPVLENPTTPFYTLLKTIYPSGSKILSGFIDNSTMVGGMDYREEDERRLLV